MKNSITYRCITSRSSRHQLLVKGWCSKSLGRLKNQDTDLKQMEKVDPDSDSCAMIAANRFAKVETMNESSNEVSGGSRTRFASGADL